MKVISRITTTNGGHHGYAIRCPGCNDVHVIDSRWTFNGDHDKPTFSPSLLCHAVPGHRGRCHSFIRDGIWEYLDDCEHALKGQRIPVPDFSWDDPSPADQSSGTH